MKNAVPNFKLGDEAVATQGIFKGRRGVITNIDRKHNELTFDGVTMRTDYAELASVVDAEEDET